MLSTRPCGTPPDSKFALYRQFCADPSVVVNTYDRMLFGVVSQLLAKGIEYIDTGWDVIAFENTAFCQELRRGLTSIATCDSDTNFVWVYHQDQLPDDEFAISHLEINVNSLLVQIKAAR